MPMDCNDPRALKCIGNERKLLGLYVISVMRGGFAQKMSFNTHRNNQKYIDIIIQSICSYRHEVRQDGKSTT